MTRSLRVWWVVVALTAAALTGCPQMFVYVPEGAESILPTQTTETSTPGVAAKPVFSTVSVLGGDPAPVSASVAGYSTDQLISLSSDTEGAVLYYTTDGVDPDPYSAQILVFDPASPIDVAAGTGTTVRIKAIALAPQMYPSEVADVEVSIDYLRASTPGISPASGTQGADFQITLSSQDAGDIWYTFSTAGPVADPVPGQSSLYTGAIPVSGHGTQAWIKAVATKSQMTDSLVASAAYTIVYPPAAAVAFEPVEGTYPTDIAVTLSTPTPGATIWYTASAVGAPADPVPGVDGSYTTPFSIIGHGTELWIKAVATASQMTAGAVILAHYTIQYPPPPVPTGLTVGGATTTTLDVSWNASAGATSYELYRDTSAGGPFTLQVYAGASLTFTDAGLASGTPYYYRVLAVGAGGPSAKSDPPVSGTTLVAPPTGVAATDGTYSTLVRITWTASTGATSYRVYRAQGAGAYSLIGSPAGLVYHDLTVTPGTTYHYKVSSHDGTTESAQSPVDDGYATPRTLFGTGVLELVFADLTGLTPMGVEFDGQFYFTISGGTTGGNRFARHFANGLPDALYAPGLDFRSLVRDLNNELIAKTYYNEIGRVSTTGATTLLYTIAGLDAQASAVFNSTHTELYALSVSTVYRYSFTDGAALGTFTLSGRTIPETTYPASIQIATSISGRVFTYAAGEVSEWDLSGNRLATVVIPIATPSDFDTTFSFSIAGERVALYNGLTGMWEIYDIGI